MNIKYIRNIILMSAFGAVLTGCDTTEDAYHLGDLSDVTISANPNQQLRLAADGKAMDIAVTSNVYWSVENLGSRFKVEASTDKGDGTISVSGPANVNPDQTPSETILITARDFNKEIRIEVIQAKLQFDMSEQDYPETRQEGGDITLRFNSSIDWKFVALEGELSWFDFSRGSTGSGDWNQIENIATWLPNYTTSPRTVKLQLQPVDASLLDFITLPESFTLTQAAGTLPENVGVSITGEPTLSECPVSVSYSSKAPIETVGVILSGNGAETRVVAPMPEGGYPLSGNVAFNLTGLAEGTRYEVRPYVISRVGETVGDMTESFITDATTPPVVYEGAKIVDVQVMPDYNMVRAAITVESDCELKEGGFYIYDPSIDVDYQLVGYFVPLAGQSQTFEHESVDFMSQNHEYLLEPCVRYIHPENGVIEVRGEKIPFKTLYRIPEEGDNTPIE